MGTPKKRKKVLFDDIKMGKVQIKAVNNTKNVGVVRTSSYNM